MKKSIFFCFLAICTYSSIKAQSIRIGLTAGLNYSKIIQDYDYFEPRFGIKAGVLAAIPIGKEFYLNPSLNFSQKGGNTPGYTATDHSGRIVGIAKSYITFNYIEMPINFMYKANEKFNIGAGPYISYLAGINTEVTIDGKTSQNLSNTDGTKSLDYGINLSTSYEFIPNWAANLNYSLGLANIDDINRYSYNLPTKISAFGLSLVKYFARGK